MDLMITNPVVALEIKNAALSLRTVKDLTEFADRSRSPLLGELINLPIAFFKAECKTSEGKKDWKEIKKRQKLGLKFKLEDDHELTPEICEAIRNWIVCDPTGRQIGNDPLGAMLSNSCGVPKPRGYVHDLLTHISQRS